MPVHQRTTSNFRTNEYNFHCGWVCTAVMTALSHVDPNFGTVVFLEAIDEPIMDADDP